MKTEKNYVHSLKLASTCKQSGRVCMTAILTAGLLLLSVSCAKNKPESPDKTAPTAVRVAPVMQQNLAQRISYVGTVHSQREVKVLAQTAGAVLSLTPEGEIVREGSTVARITAPEISARSSRMEAEVERAQTERDFLCETYKTDRKLGEAGAITKRQVDMSKKACDAATAALNAARAGSREVVAVRGKNTEQAPFGGLVLQWLVEPGQNVMPGMPLLLFGSHNLEVRVKVAERDIEKGVRVNIPVLVRLGGEAHRLQVSRIAPTATGLGRTFDVRIAIPNELSATMAQGTSIRIEFLVAEATNSIAISEKALTKINGTDAIFIIDDNRAREVKVIPGIRDRGLIEVKGEVTVGAWVAMSNLDLLKNGAHVFAVHPTNNNEVQP